MLLIAYAISNAVFPASVFEGRALLRPGGLLALDAGMLGGEISTKKFLLRCNFRFSEKRSFVCHQQKHATVNLSVRRLWCAEQPRIAPDDHAHAEALERRTDPLLPRAQPCGPRAARTALELARVRVGDRVRPAAARPVRARTTATRAPPPPLAAGRRRLVRGTVGVKVRAMARVRVSGRRRLRRRGSGRPPSRVGCALARRRPAAGGGGRHCFALSRR